MKKFWLSSPYGYFDGYAKVSNVEYDGYLYFAHVDSSTINAYPSISLKFGAKIAKGNGTKKNPYIVGEQPYQNSNFGRCVW